MDKEIASLEQAVVFHAYFHKMQYFINKSVLLFAVAMWPVTGQDLQNTKWPAVRYFDYSDWGSGDTENTNEG